MNLDFILGGKSFSLTGEHDPKARLSRMRANRNLLNTNEQLSAITGPQKFGADARNRPTRLRIVPSSAPPSAPTSAPKAASSKPSASSAPARPSTVVKAGLAKGSQVAVVKLASYSSGRTSISNLLNYQSRQGELALEKDTGESLTGKEQLRELVNDWSQNGSAREKSKDILSFRATLPEKPDEDQVREALSLALQGHRYAFRIEEKKGEHHVHIVTSAASSRRENSRAFRIFDNAKSLDALEDRLCDSFKSEVVLDLPKWRHGVSGASEALFALTRGGQIEARDNHNKAFQTADHPLKLAKSWERDLRSKGTRDLAHIIISAKPGTDKQAFISAGRAMLAKEFADHEFVFALHEDRQHLHLHVALRMESKQGERLDPNIGDFRRWRETMAEMARDRFINMEATSRFDQAHKPAYKLKDVRMIERNIAPDSVRRRVEAVKTREVHIPSREEGKKRANESHSQWKQMATASFVSAPSIQADTIRMYRGEGLNAKSSSPIFTTDRASAEGFAGTTGRLTYLDVPRAQLNDYQLSHAHKNAFVLTKAQAAQAIELERVNPAQIIPFSHRAQKAVELTPINTEKEFTTTHADPRQTLQNLHLKFQAAGDEFMPVSHMIKQRDAMITAIDDIQKHVEPQNLEQFKKTRQEFLAGLNESIDDMRERDQNNPRIEGKGEKPNKPRHLDGFTFEPRDGGVHYQPHEDSGQRLKTAFIDRGDRLEIWKNDNDKAILAALQVAQDKWESIQVTGSEKYKETVIRLAAEHGFNVTNPELQERLQIERERFTSERSSTEQNLRNVQADIIKEANIETSQAEHNSVRHPVHDAATKTEAEIARKDAQTVSESSTNPIPKDLAASRQINELSNEQQRLINEANQRKADFDAAVAQSEAKDKEKPYRGQK